MVRGNLTKRLHRVKLAALLLGTARVLAAQDPAEPPPTPGPVRAPAFPAPAGSRSAVSTKALAETLDELLACGTRHSLSSWEDPKRGIGCGRDRILARYRRIAESSAGRLEV